MKKIQWLCLPVLVITASCSTSEPTGYPKQAIGGFYSSATPTPMQAFAGQHAAGKIVTSSRPTRTRTGIIVSWKDNAMPARVYHKILVLGIVGTAEKTVQNDLENKFAGGLQRIGYTAVPSSSLPESEDWSKMDRETLFRKLAGYDVDAVITVVLTDKERVPHCPPCNIYASAHGYYYNNLWSYVNACSQRVLNRSYVADSRCFLESNLYDLHSKKLIYSAQTQSFTPFLHEKERLEYSGIVFNNMKKQDILQGVSE